LWPIGGDINRFHCNKNYRIDFPAICQFAVYQFACFLFAVMDGRRHWGLVHAPVPDTAKLV